MNINIKFLIFIILLIFSISFYLVIYDFIRRILTQRKYKKLDNYRIYFREVIEEIIKLPFVENNTLWQKLKTSSKLKRQSILEILISLSLTNPDKILEISKKLGFINEYEKKLNSSRDFERGEACKVLSSLNSKESLIKIFDTIKKEDKPECTFIGFLSACRLIEKDFFIYFLNLLHEKYNKGNISIKATSLVFTDFINRFKETASFTLSEFLKDQNLSTSFIVAILDGIFYSDYIDETLGEISKEQLKSEMVEIISKALKVLAKFDDISKISNLDEIIFFLKHPVWFIRLSALNVLEKNINKDITKYVMLLLEDEHALIRKKSAKVLFKLPEEEIIVFLPEWLKIKDPYGRDAIIEEMFRTGLFYKLNNQKFKKQFEEIKKFLNQNYRLVPELLNGNN